MSGNGWLDDLSLLKISSEDSLKNLKVSNYIGYCLGNKELRNFTENYLQKFAAYKELKPKSSNIALEKKNEAEKKLKDQFRNAYQSLDLYSESIIYAPRNDETLPLAYLGRSKVLFELRRYAECLQDIDMALSTGYDGNENWMLLSCKKNCLERLNQRDKINELKVDIHKLKQKQISFKDINKKIEEEINKKVSKPAQLQLPEITGGENKDFVYASNYLGVYYNKTKGRHVLATHDIEIGDVLLVEKPFTSVLLKEGCHNCWENVRVPIPCWNCLDVFYCSPSCRNESWEKFHHLECGYYGILKSLGIAYLCLKIVLTASTKFDEFKRIVKEIKIHDYEEGFISYTSKGYEGVYNLVHHTEKHEACDLFHYAMTAILLTLHLKKHTNYFPEGSTEEDLNFVASAILRHIMQTICNCHAVVGTYDTTSKGFSVEREMKRVASAIYTSTSILNHSCESSIVYSFVDQFLVGRASKAIKKGEEVCICYGPNARRMERWKRQEILSLQYFFNCECTACLERFDIQDKLTAFKCPICRGPLVPLDEANPEMRICLKCGEIKIISKETMKEKDLFYHLLREGEELFEENVQLALRTFIRCWRLGREIFYTFHKDLCYSADQMARCWTYMMEMKKTVLVLRCCVLSVEERFGPVSLEVAGELIKLGDALYCYGDYPSIDFEEKRAVASECFKAYERAEKIITLLCGPHDEDSIKIKNTKENMWRKLVNILHECDSDDDLYC